MAQCRIYINDQEADQPGLVVRENRTVQIRLEPADPAHLPLLALHIAGVAQGEGAIPQSRPGGVEWRFTPWSAAGLLPLAVTGPDGVQRLQLQVEPAKLTAAEYEFLLADLRRLAYGIIYTLYAPTHRGLREHPPAADPVQRLLERFAFLEEADAVAQVVRLVRLLPVHQVIAPITEAMPQERVRRLPLAGLHAVARQSDRRRVPATRREASPDCYENRVVKLLLRSLRRLCQLLAGEAGRWLAARAEGAPLSQPVLDRMRQVQGRSQEWVRLLDRELLQEPWPAVGEAAGIDRPSTVFIMQPVYRELLQWYRRLQASWESTVDAPSLTLPLRSLPDLYEYWCFARVVAALQRGLGEPGFDQGLVRWRGGGFEFGLESGGRSRIRFTQGVTVYYNKHYLGFTGLNYYPDITIEVAGRAGPARLVILDAKYRVDKDRGYEQEDIDKMHTYRDALTRADRRVESAFILYPGEELFDPAGGRVGAVPLRPGLGGGADGALEQTLALCLGQLGVMWKGALPHADVNGAGWTDAAAPAGG